MEAGRPRTRPPYLRRYFYLDAAAGGDAEGFIVVRGANFGIDPEDDERNVVQLRVGDVECLGAAWRSTTELRCQMQPIPVGETTLHVVAARSTAAPYEVLADCAPGSFRRLDEKLQQLWCQPCPRGTTCAGLARRPVAAYGTFGYRLRKEHATHALYVPCEPADACAGGTLGAAGSSRRCEGMEPHQTEDVAECTSCTAPCVAGLGPPHMRGSCFGYDLLTESAVSDVDCLPPSLTGTQAFCAARAPRDTTSSRAAASRAPRTRRCSCSEHCSSSCSFSPWASGSRRNCPTV